MAAGTEGSPAQRLSHLHERLRPTNEQLLDLESRGCVVEKGRWSPLNYDRLKENVEAAKKVHGVNICDHYTQIRGDRDAYEAFVRILGKGINRTLASVADKFQRDYVDRRVYVDEGSREINDDFNRLEAYIDALIEKKYA